MRFLESITEKMIFASRWLLAPLYLGLAGGLVVLVIRFGHNFFEFVAHATTVSQHDLITDLLQLLDLTLLGNLILIVIFSGYENFVSKIRIADASEDKPHWMGRIDYSGLKIKLIGSLVAISVIELLKDFMQEGPYDTKRELWRVIIHLTFVVSGVLFALMDGIADKRVRDDLVVEETLHVGNGGPDLPKPTVTI